MNISINFSTKQKKSFSFIFIINKYLLCFLPLALVTGPLIPEAICIISIFVFLFLSIQNKDWKYYKNIFFYLLVLWSLYLIVSSLFSDDFSYSLESSLFYFRHGLFAISLWFMIDKDPRIIKMFLLSLYIIFFILIIDGFIQYFTGENIFGYPYNPNKARLSSFFGDEWILGNYLSRLTPLLFALTFFTFLKPRKYLIILCSFVVAIDVLVYLTGERTAFFNLLLSLLLMIIFLNNFKKFRIATFLVSLILITLLSFFNEKIRYRMVDNSLNQINIFSDEYVADHELFLRSSIKMFIENPITGIGPKMYRKLCNNENYYYSNELYNSCSTHPHNTYLQLLSETGIIGFLFILSIFIYFSYLLVKNLIGKIFTKKIFLSDMQICIIISILVNLFPLIPTLSFFNNWINIIYFLPIGFLLNTYNSKNKL